MADLVFRGIADDAPAQARWRAQNIVFSPEPPGSLYLVQHSGGPCGVLACLQGFVLAHAVFERKPARAALLDAMYEILARAAGQGRAVVVVLESERQVAATSASHAKQLLEEAAFERASGVVRFVQSVVHSRGAEAVAADMDDREGCLVGRFGHCGQEMVNLLLSGRASSQMHDGAVTMEGGLELRGVQERPRVGFLTHLEALRYSRVGSFLKNPVLPIWVLGSEAHYTLLYSADPDADRKTPAQAALELGQRAFGRFDAGERGFVDQAALPSLLQALDLGPRQDEVLRRLTSLCEDVGGILLFPDFWQIVGPLVRAAGASAPDAAPPQPPAGTWGCARCTYLNDSAAIVCVMCASPKSAMVEVAGEPWACRACTYVNSPRDAACGMCAAGPAASGASGASGGAEAQLQEQEPGGRRLELIHVNGLLRTAGQAGAKTQATVTRVVITTVDAALLVHDYQSQDPFEQTLFTKWKGCEFEYPDGGQRPNIKG
jgi:hypothetical protein